MANQAHRAIPRLRGQNMGTGAVLHRKARAGTDIRKRRKPARQIVHSGSDSSVGTEKVSSWTICDARRSAPACRMSWLS